METFTCFDCGIHKNFPAGLRSPTEKYRCFECFNSQSSNVDVIVKIVIENGIVDYVDCPAWMNYRLIDYDVIGMGDCDEFKTTKEADTFLNNKGNWNDNELLIVIRRGIAETFNHPAGVEVEIKDLDEI